MRAQHYDENDVKWRNQSAPGKLEDDDGEEDPRTDAELLDTLFKTATSDPTVEDIDGLSRWTLLGAREELPDPLEDEDVVLEEGYDAKKAEEEEKKNQVDTANFSGGGKYYFNNLRKCGTAEPPRFAQNGPSMFATCTSKGSRS